MACAFVVGVKLAKDTRLSVIATKITSVLTDLNFIICTSERNESVLCK